MSKDTREFEISRLLELSEKNKYAVTVAAFEVIDNLDVIQIAKKYSNRKPAVKALTALYDGVVQYDYIPEEDRRKLEEELQMEKKDKHTASFDQVFHAGSSAAPIADDSEEDLEEIGETIPVEAMDDSDADLPDADEDDESDDDTDDEDDDDDDAEDEDSDDEE